MKLNRDLNQYYTGCRDSDALVGGVSLNCPSSALDLGFGSGNLLDAAKKRWNNIELIGLDIDQNNVSAAQIHERFVALEMSGLDCDLPSKINELFGSIDLLISNPPYASIDLDRPCKTILKRANLIECMPRNSKKVPSEIIFLAQNLSLLTDQGEIGIILPSGIASGENWQPLRELLFTEYQVSNVSELPRNSFKGTDALAFIFRIRKKSNRRKNNTILTSVGAGPEISVSYDEAIFRCDYSHYTNFVSEPNLFTVDETGFSLFRGRHSNKYLESIGVEFVHSTDIKNSPIFGCLSDVEVMPFTTTARAGDILINRVGSRCVGRSAYVSSGYVGISDCVIGVRPNSFEDGEIIKELIQSDDFKSYVDKSALGVGARYLTYNIIRNFLTGSYDDFATKVGRL